jgi:glycerol-3-phosphate O-acyltransferase
MGKEMIFFIHVLIHLFVSDIFLVDHAWTTSPENAKKELLQNQALLDRLENLMDIEKEELVLDEEEEEEIKPSDELIRIVASQANVSEKEAEEALEAENNEVVNAIMVCTYMIEQNLLVTSV